MSRARRKPSTAFLRSGWRASAAGASSAASVSERRLAHAAMTRARSAQRFKRGPQMEEGRASVATMEASADGGSDGDGLGGVAEQIGGRVVLVSGDDGRRFSRACCSGAVEGRAGEPGRRHGAPTGTRLASLSRRWQPCALSMREPRDRDVPGGSTSAMHPAVRNTGCPLLLRSDRLASGAGQTQAERVPVTSVSARCRG